MLNSDPNLGDAAGPQQEAALRESLRAGSAGAVWLAGLATAAVVAIWFAFYLLVFVPRMMTP